MSACTNSTACMHDPACEDDGCQGKPAKEVVINVQRRRQFRPDFGIEGPRQHSVELTTPDDAMRWAAWLKFFLCLAVITVIGGFAAGYVAGLLERLP